MNRGNTTLAGLLEPYIARIEADLVRLLVEPAVPESLAEAMRYCVLGGGKRLRPSLVLMLSRACGGDSDDELIRRAAAAVEFVHTYSLVHDDLPAMDNDSLRRGRPTAHVKFGEAMAILAGDALLTRAFGVLAETHFPLSGKLVAELASAAGAAGMIAGQVADMKLCELPAGVEGVNYIHSRKTAAIILAAARMGAICASASDMMLNAVSRYARSLGMAFQLVDDLLDVTGTSRQIGKTAGKDAAAGKKTHVEYMGVEKAKAVVGSLTQEALAALEPLGSAGKELASLVELLAARMH